VTLAKVGGGGGQNANGPEDFERSEITQQNEIHNILWKHLQIIGPLEAKRDLPECQGTLF